MKEWMLEVFAKNPDSGFWLAVDRVSILLSYVVVGSIVAFVYQFWRVVRRRRHLRKVKGESARPCALCVSFGGGRIRQAVEDHLARSYAGRKIPLREYHEGKDVTPQTVHRHLEKIRRLKEEMQTEGVTELHLFLKGPVALAVPMGAIFDNWVEVKIYHHGRGGAYVPWTTLGQAKSAGMAEEMAERVVEVGEGSEREAG